MARVSKKKTENKEETVENKVESRVVKPLTRAQKKTATQSLIKDVLSANSRKHNDLIDEVSKAYAEKFGGEETENMNDVKGRVGSVLDIMKKEGEVLYEGGMYALKTENKPVEREVKPVETVKKEEKTAKKPARSKSKKAEVKAENKAEEIDETPVVAVEEKQEKQAKSAVKKTAGKTKKTKAEKSEKADKETKEEPKKQEQEETLPLPPAPMQPIAPVAPITPEVAPEPMPETAPEKDEPLKKQPRAKSKKAKTEKKAPQSTETANEPPMSALNEEIPQEKTENQAEEKVVETLEIKNPPAIKEKGELAPKNVMDMSFLFGNVKPKTEKVEKAEKAEEKPAQAETQKTVVAKKEQTETKPEIKQEAKQETKPAIKPEIKQEIKQETKQEVKQESKQENRNPIRRATTRGNVKDVRKVERPQTADERLRDAFLKRLRSLGGDYFEYYSVYLLERYSMKNGRRLESMRISGGERDGGIDGEIELTDKFGFKETIYIQSKNWDPEKGKEEYWVVGETLLQQFIGACACRQAKDRKQHCRGIFITTSRFTPDAKHILDDMSDKIVGYDGADLYEAAKECQFGLTYENGNWKLDEKLLSGTKAFFNML